MPPLCLLSMGAAPAVEMGVCLQPHSERAQRAELESEGTTHIQVEARRGRPRPERGLAASLERAAPKRPAVAVVAKDNATAGGDLGPLSHAHPLFIPLHRTHAVPLCVTITH